MATASETLHESDLPPDVVDRHRAIVSLIEELEAVDWYDQRVAATDDPDLAAILAHNRDEEKEHAAMTLEWLRRRDPELDRMLRTYLFTEESIVGLEESGADEETPVDTAPVTRPGLRIGSLRATSTAEAEAGGVR